jgi:hypothetical protein
VIRKIVEVARATFGDEVVSWSFTFDMPGLSASSPGPVIATNILNDAGLQPLLRWSETNEVVGLSNASIYYPQSPHGGHQRQGSITYNWQSAHSHAGIEINFPGDIARNIVASDAVREQFSVTSYLDIISSIGSQSERSAMQMRERSIADLKEQLDKAAGFMLKLAERESETRRKLQEELETAYIKKRDELDQTHLKRLLEIDGQFRDKENALAERERLHEERVKDFERDEAKLVRRKLLGELQKILKESESLRLSPETVSKRTPVVWGVLAASFLSASLLLCSLWFLIFDFEKYGWRPAFSFVTGSFALFGTVIYYLKWSDRWFREHAEAEFAAKRQKADIVQASWLAELVSEWTSQNGQRELPKELLEAYTRNIFRASGPVRETEHPFEQITSLLRRAQELEFGKDRFVVKAKEEK